MHEKEVIELLKSRDEGGVAQLLAHFGPLMRYVIAPILSNESDREECLSECAMRVWERIDRYDPERGSWTAWLTAIARNAALNRARAHRADHAPLDEAGDTPSSEPTPEEALLLKERREALQTALSRPQTGGAEPFLPQILLYAVHRPDCRRAGRDRARRRGAAAPPAQKAPRRAGR